MVSWSATYKPPQHRNRYLVFINLLLSPRCTQYELLKSCALASVIMAMGHRRVAVVWFSLVQGEISLNPELDFGSGLQIFACLNLMLREPDFRSSSGYSRV